ncbi:MAG: hypothetical protein KTR26_11705 [Flammeovirgaceae bacterium]|nr:hypothetical protein [Flammeovirgaceae bacterium]
MTRINKISLVIAASLLVFSCSNVKTDGEASTTDSLQTEVVADSLEAIAEADSTIVSDSMAIASDSIMISEGDSATIEK